MSLAQKAGKAGALLLFRKMWGALVNIGVMAYLARTLDKSDFGLAAISGTLIGFIQTVGISGIGEYIVFYNGQDQEKVRNAAFWLNLVLTAAVVIIVLIAAPFWAKLYKDPRIFNLICLLLVGFVFNMFSTIPQAVFRKSMDYQPMVAIQTVFGTISQISQVAFAYLGFGVYSLALPSAIIAPFLALTLFWRSGFRPNWKYRSRGYWKQIFNYTKHVSGSRILGKFVNEGDTLLIGKLLGMEALGIYNIAFNLANIFNKNLLPIITNISLPVFAAGSNNKIEMQNRFLKMTSVIGFLFFPVCGLMIISAPYVISLLYGAQWEPSVLPFQILTVFAAFRAISSPTSGLINALNKPHLGFYFNALFVPVFLLSIYLSASQGLIVTCWTITVLRILGGLLLIHISIQLINIKFFEFYKKIAEMIIITAIIMAPIMFYSTSFSTLGLILSILGYLIAYISINRFFMTDTFITFTSVVSHTNPSLGKFVKKILSI